MEEVSLRLHDPMTNRSVCQLPDPMLAREWEKAKNSSAVEILRRYLMNWAEILVELGRKNTSEQQRLVRDLNKKFGLMGPNRCGSPRALTEVSVKSGVPPSQVGQRHLFGPMSRSLMGRSPSPAGED